MGETFASFKPGLDNLLTYSWVLWIFVPIAILIFGAYMWKVWKDKKKQWTHKLVVRRVLNTGYLSKPVTMRMRRFPLIRTGEIFELEHPLLGSYLIPELDSYTGTNEYSIIIDTNNRVYTNKGETFNKDKGSVDVSAKHSEIDIALGDFKQKYQEVHKTPKRIELMQIAKFAMIGLLIIGVMVVSIKGIEQWGKNHNVDAEKASAEMRTWQIIEEVMKEMQSSKNVDILLADKLKDLYGTENLQSEIRQAKET